MASSSNEETTVPKETNSGQQPAKKPICVIVLGMAGSGKTTFVKRATSYLSDTKNSPYVINLDPACHEVPYLCNIDIRDTVNYKEVMKQYSLGPNGAIITSLNLFATKFDQIIQLIEKRSNECEYCIIDTPGQIEVFTWSASGSIITESLASTFPTVIVYVLDVSRSVNPVTFMSNMLYACSILYKSKLPFIIAMNKNDIIHHSFAGEWIQDWEAFQNSLENESSYAVNLTRSLSLALDEFYKNIKFVGISSLTGQGMVEFFDMLKIAAQEYETEYRPEYENLKKTKAKEERLRQERQMKQLAKDLAEGKGEALFQDKNKLAASAAGLLKKSERAKHIRPEVSHPYQPDDNAEDDEERHATDNEEESLEDKMAVDSFKAYLNREIKKAADDKADK